MVYTRQFILLLLGWFQVTLSLEVIQRNSFETEDFTPAIHPKKYELPCVYENSNEFQMEVDFWFRVTDTSIAEEITLLASFTQEKSIFFAIKINTNASDYHVLKKNGYSRILLPLSEVGSSWNRLFLTFRQTKFTENKVTLGLVMQINGQVKVDTSFSIISFLAENKDFEILICSEDLFESACDG